MGRVPTGPGTTEGGQLWFQPPGSEMRQKYFKKGEKSLHSVGPLLPGPFRPINMHTVNQPSHWCSQLKGQGSEELPQALQVSQTSPGCEADTAPPHQPRPLSSGPLDNQEPSESRTRCRERAGKRESWGNFLPKLQNLTWSPGESNNTRLWPTIYHNQAFKPEATL